jgi:hypothetical protein
MWTQATEKLSTWPEAHGQNFCPLVACCLDALYKIHPAKPCPAALQSGENEGHFLLIEGTIHGQELAILNIHLPNMSAPKYILKT